MSRKPLLIIFVTVFIDLLGFGIVLPLLPRYGEHFLPTDIQLAGAALPAAPSAAPGYVAAVLSALAFLFGLFELPESLKPGVAARRHSGLFSVVAGLRAMSRGSHGLILATIFLTTFAFAQFESTLSLLTKHLGGADAVETVHDWRRGAILGCLMASFSAMQFLFAPLWGRLSDRIGRRPVLLIGLAGSTVSYFLFAVVTQLGNRGPILGLSPLVWLFVTRIGAGISGATISTAQAYIADSTDEKSRGKGMALIGAAFGIGFTFGPLLGAAFVSGQASGHGMSDRANFFVFAYIGFILTLSQGMLVRRLIPKLGEFRMGLVGVALMTLGLLLIGVASHQSSVSILIAVLPVVVIGYSAATPSLLSMLSLTSGAEEQGELLGIGQSMSSLARILGPIAGLTLHGRGIAMPYWFAAGLMAFGVVMVVGLRSAVQRSKEPLGAVPSPAE
jgi:MFS transporter, DHA1 family, tetracycline resistance protein